MYPRLFHSLYRLQLRTAVRRSPMLDEAMESDLAPLLTGFLRAQASAVAEAHNLGNGRLGEAFRKVRFGDMEEFFEIASEPLPGADGPVVRGDTI